MAHLAKYKKSDFKRVSWNEYGRILDALYARLKRHLEANKVKIDAVVPILRGGAFSGTYLAYRLGMLKVLPVQYKYFYSGGKGPLKRLLSFPKTAIGKRDPTFLLVENNHCFGATAANAAKDLQKAFPGCRIVYAAAYMDYSFRNAVDASVSLHGKYTNETRALTAAQCRAKGIEANTLNLFPWESKEEEWKMVSEKQFEYADLDEVFSRAQKGKKR